MTIAPPAFSPQLLPLITAEEFFERFGDSGGCELVDGRIQEMPMPGGIHGKVCLNVGFHLKLYLMRNPIGHAMSNDTFVLLKRDPDTMRGPDICYVSFDKIPQNALPSGALSIPPELIFEVLSPSDTVKATTSKIQEYLTAGVTVGILLNPDTRTATIFRSQAAEQTFAANETLTIPDILPGFAVKAGDFFA